MSMMWQSPRGPYGCGICAGDVVEYRGKRYTTEGFGASMDGWCGYSLVAVDDHAAVHELVPTSDMAFVMSAKDAEWERLRSFAP